MPFRNLKTSQVAKLAIIVFALFVALYYVFSNSTLIILFNSIFIGVLVANFIAYFPIIRQTIKQGKLDRVSQFALAVGLFAIELILAKGNSLVGHAFHLGIKVYSNFWAVSSSFLAVIAATLLFTAPAMDNYGNIRAAPRNWLIAAVVAGTIVAGVLIYLG